MFFSFDNPPVKTIPLSIISEESSGGVFCKTSTIASMMFFKNGNIGSTNSFVLTFIVCGNPVVVLLPFTFIVNSFVTGIAEHIDFLIFSAVFLPMFNLCLSNIYLTIA